MACGVWPNEVLRRGGRRAHVEAVDGAEGDHAVLMHLGVQRGGGAAEEAEELLSEEEEGGRARLRRAHRADAVLHLHRRRVGAALDLETREAAEGRARPRRHQRVWLSKGATVGALVAAHVFCSSCAHRRNCPPVCHDWQNSIRNVESMRSIAATTGPALRPMANEATRSWAVLRLCRGAPGVS